MYEGRYYTCKCGHVNREIDRECVKCGHSEATAPQPVSPSKSSDLAMSGKACERCKFLKKYTSESGSWMNVCESEEPDEEQEGLFRVIAVDTAQFDASDCLDFKEA